MNQPCDRDHWNGRCDVPSSKFIADNFECSYCLCENHFIEYALDMVDTDGSYIFITEDEYLASKVVNS